jgi:hypothetical protein
MTPFYHASFGRHGVRCARRFVILDGKSRVTRVWPVTVHAIASSRALIRHFHTGIQVPL